MTRIAIFASGRGSNALKIIDHLEEYENIAVGAILSNKQESGIVESAHKMDIPCLVFNRKDFYDSSIVLKFLKAQHIDYLILAGFLWLIPDNLIEFYSDKIINIHPSLLPKYGGKGMYGMHVHRAVKEHEDHYSGITIHLVNEKYDEGRILLQTKIKLEKSDSPEQIASKVLKLEHHFFPRVVAAYCK